MSEQDELPPPDYRHFWPGFLRGVGTEPRDVTSIRGASGISHNLLAVGVDDGGQRVVLVSADTDARSAALAQADIQAALGRVRVLMARAVLFDVGQVAEVVRSATGLSYVSAEQMSDLHDQQRNEELFRPYIEQIAPVVVQWIRNAQGVKGFNVAYGLTQLVEQLKSLKLVIDDDADGPSRLDLTGLLDKKTLGDDRTVGICPIPFHEFSETDMEAVNSGQDREAVARVLRERQVLQYFYPAADQLALGLIDRTAAPASKLIEQLCAVPELGHPFGPNELAGVGSVALTQMVERLQALNLTTEGELGIELTAEGQVVRASVQFQPRESLISRVFNRFNINFNMNS